MWGNGGWGGGANNAGLQGALTRADLCQDMNFQGLENGVRNVNDAVNVGFSNLNSTICHQQYDTASLVNGVNSTVMNGFHGVDNAVCQLGYQTQNGFNQTQVAMMQGQNALQTQLAQCCCDTKGVIRDAQFANQVGQNAIQNQISDCCCTIGREIERGFADTAYRMATDTCALQTTMANNTRDIIDSQNAGTRAILDYLCQEKISDLQNENQSLRLAASQQAQNAYLVEALGPKSPQPAWLVPNPSAIYNPCTGTVGYSFSGNGCGCNNGCGNYN